MIDDEALIAAAGEVGIEARDRSRARIVAVTGSVGKTTTKETIAKVRDRSHWNAANIKPRDPVILGLCSQSDLNALIVSIGAEPAPTAVEDDAA